MPRHDSPARSILGILAGVATLVVAAGEALATIPRGPRVQRPPAPASLGDVMRSRPTRRRKPPESGLPVPAVPPRGPLPLQGGAAATLSFETD